MVNPIISSGTAFISGLENSKSLVPMVLKDSIDVLGRTTMAYTQTDKKSSAHEARERFIEETGTGILWLGSIPFLRKILDKPLFNAFNPNPKIFKMDSSISFKKINNPESEQGIKDGKLVEKLLINKDKLPTDGKNYAAILRKRLKYAHVSKTLVSTLVPFYLLAFVLPKLNQGLTKKLIKREKEKEANLEKTTNSSNNIDNKNVKFESNNSKKAKDPSFKGLKDLQDLINPIKLAEGAQVDPVNNMLLLDYAISGNRVRVARNRQERIETIIKEGGIIYFFYHGADQIKHGLQKFCNKIGKPIDLDFITLKTKSFKQNLQKALHNPEQASEFYQVMDKNSKGSNEKRILDFIDDAIHKDYNPKTNTFEHFEALQSAKDTGLFGEMKGILKNKENKQVNQLFKDIKDNKKSIRDSKEYIDTKAIETLGESMKKFYTNAKSKCTNQKSIDKLVNATKKYKAGMIIINIVICNMALGYALPELQYFIREKVWGNKEFPGVKG